MAEVDIYGLQLYNSAVSLNELCALTLLFPKWLTMNLIR